MYQKNNRIFRIFALFTALTLLPSLFFGNNENKSSEKGQLHSAHNYITLSDCDMHRYPAAVFTDEIFRNNAVRITHGNSLRRFGFPDFLRYDFDGSGIFLLAVCILFILLKLRSDNGNFSLKMIIRYIHDQDGIKI